MEYLHLQSQFHIHAPPYPATCSDFQYSTPQHSKQKMDGNENVVLRKHKIVLIIYIIMYFGMHIADCANISIRNLA